MPKEKAVEKKAAQSKVVEKKTNKKTAEVRSTDPKLKKQAAKTDSVKASTNMPDLVTKSESERNRWERDVDW